MYELLRSPIHLGVAAVILFFLIVATVTGKPPNAMSKFFKLLAWLTIAGSLLVVWPVTPIAVQGFLAAGAFFVIARFLEKHGAAL